MLANYFKSPYLSKIGLLILGSGIIYLSTFINFTVPGIDIPVTGQSLAVLVVSYVWPRKLGLYAVVLYVFIGVCGFPVFSSGASGMQTLMGNSGGYIYGFILSAWFVFRCKRVFNQYKFFQVFVVMLLATLIILLIGYIHLLFMIGAKNAFLYGVKPFLIGGLVKVVIGSIIVWGIRK